LGRVQDGFHAQARGQRLIQQTDALYQAQPQGSAVLSLR
jgi:hypothetical protein